MHKHNHPIQYRNRTSVAAARAARAGRDVEHYRDECAFMTGLNFTSKQESRIERYRAGAPSLLSLWQWVLRFFVVVFAWPLRETTPRKPG